MQLSAGGYEQTAVSIAALLSTRMKNQHVLLACALLALFVTVVQPCTVLELSGSGFAANVNHLLWAFPVFDNGINGTLFLDNTWFQYRCKKNGGLHDFLDLKPHIVPWTAEKERKGKQACAVCLLLANVWHASSGGVLGAKSVLTAAPHGMQECVRLQLPDVKKLKDTLDFTYDELAYTAASKVRAFVFCQPEHALYACLAAACEILRTRDNGFAAGRSCGTSSQQWRTRCPRRPKCWRAWRGPSSLCTCAAATSARRMRTWCDIRMGAWCRPCKPK